MILITGGGSQVGSAIAQALSSSHPSVKVVFGVKTEPSALPSSITANTTAQPLPPDERAKWGDPAPPGYPTVKLDWKDATSIAGVFERIGEPVQAVYLVLPPGPADVASGEMLAFVDRAIESGVKRFVLIAGSTVEKDAEGVPAAKVWRGLEERGVEYFVLRPTLFMDNVLNTHGENIRTRSEFSSTLDAAKIPLVSVKDIAEGAVDALTRETLECSDAIIVGPELLTFDQVAETLSDVLCRTITHRVVSAEERIKAYRDELLKSAVEAEWIVNTMERRFNAGSEEKRFGREDTIVGKESLREWAGRFRDRL